jgi:hypothetical protein
VAEAPAEDAEVARLVAEPPGGLPRAKVVDEVGAQGFVLALPGVRRFQEEAVFFRYLMWCLFDGIRLHQEPRPRQVSFR